MTNNYTYAINTQSARILPHFPAAQLFVRDDEHSDAELLMQARVRSGDYFMTLASEIDKIAQNLVARGAPEAQELERLVTELLYVNKNFTIHKK